MRTSKLVTSIVAGAIVAGAATVALATSASASDDGTTLTGHVYTLNSTTGVAGSYYEDEVLSGTFARSWSTLAVDAPCPTGTQYTTAWVRLPFGTDQTQWDEAQITGTEAYTSDSKGAYLSTTFDTMDNAVIQSFLAGSTKTLPLALVCYRSSTSGGLVPLGHFETSITISATDANGNGTWSIPTPPPALAHKPAATATTTTLAGAWTGTALALTATVSPATAVGTVAFTEGTTTVGTATVAAGVASVQITPTVAAHTYTATFVPANPTSYKTSAATKKLVYPTTTALTGAFSGSNLVLTSTVSPATVPGTVKVTEGTTVIGTATVSKGVATVTVASPAAGNHTYTTTFTPTDATSFTSSSATATFPLATSVVLGGYYSGKNLVLTATVTPAVAGTVAITEGSTKIGSATVTKGVATLTVTAPSVGGHTYIATFTPTDTKTYKSSSTTTTVPYPTTTTLTGAFSGTSLVLKVTVAPSSAAGTVTVTEGSATVGTGTVTNGVATITIASPTAGSHTYRATFAPTDPKSYRTSVGVATFPIATTVAATGKVSGAAIVLTATVTPATVPGTVKVTEGSKVVGSATASGGVATVTVASATAGSHTYTLTFTPTDAKTYTVSSTVVTVTK